MHFDTVGCNDPIASPIDFCPRVTTGDPFVLQSSNSQNTTFAVAESPLSRITEAVTCAHQFAFSKDHRKLWATNNEKALCTEYIHKLLYPTKKSTLQTTNLISLPRTPFCSAYRCFQVVPFGEEFPVAAREGQARKADFWNFGQSARSLSKPVRWFRGLDLGYPGGGGVARGSPTIQT